MCHESQCRDIAANPLSYPPETIKQHTQLLAYLDYLANELTLGQFEPIHSDH